MIGLISDHIHYSDIRQTRSLTLLLGGDQAPRTLATAVLYRRAVDTSFSGAGDRQGRKLKTRFGTVGQKSSKASLSPLQEQEKARGQSRRPGLDQLCRKSVKLPPLPGVEGSQQTE